MQRLFFRLQYLVIGCALLEYSAAHADTCVMFHKRVPVKAVCGHVINIAGEKLNNIDLTLTGETGLLLTTRSDAQGSFSFGSISQGDYALHAAAPGYHAADRKLRVTHTNEGKCSPKIEITLGFQVCDTGIRVKGVDKFFDLDSEFGK
jgi:hypothetical protein